MRNTRIPVINILVTVSLAFFSIMAANAVSAQDDAENGTPSAWLKVCDTDPDSEKELCLITHELRTATGQFLASVAIREITGEVRKTMILSVPLGMLIQPGLRAGVDDGEKIEIKFGICFPNACFADVVVDENFIDVMKNGETLIVSALNQQAKPVPFRLSLEGFKDAYEGDPLDAEALREQQLRLQDELSKRAENTRQKLIEEQNRASEESLQVE